MGGVCPPGVTNLDRPVESGAGRTSYGVRKGNGEIRRVNINAPPICVDAADKVYGLGTSQMEQIQIKHSGWEHELLL